MFNHHPETGYEDVVELGHPPECRRCAITHSVTTLGGFDPSCLVSPEAVYHLELAALVSPSLKCRNHLPPRVGDETLGRAGTVGAVPVLPGHSSGSCLPSVRSPEQAEPVNLERPAALHSCPPPSPRSASLWLFVAMTASLGPCMDGMLPVHDGGTGEGGCPRQVHALTPCAAVLGPWC